MLSSFAWRVSPGKRSGNNLPFQAMRQRLDLAKLLTTPEKRSKYGGQRVEEPVTVAVCQPQVEGPQAEAIRGQSLSRTWQETFGRGFSQSHASRLPPGRCLKTFGRTTNKGRRVGSGSHHLMFTVLYDLQSLPPAIESKTLQPKVANPILQITKS